MSLGPERRDQSSSSATPGSSMPAVRAKKSTRGDNLLAMIACGRLQYYLLRVSNSALLLLSQPSDRPARSPDLGSDEPRSCAVLPEPAGAHR